MPAEIFRHVYLKVSNIKIFKNKHFLQLDAGNKTPTFFRSDDSDTQDPTSLFRQQDPSEKILQELRELKELVQNVQKRQGTMEKAIKNLASRFSTQEFEVAKSSHAVSILTLYIYISVLKKN